MFEFKTLGSKVDHPYLGEPEARRTHEPKQQRMMVVALALLIVALGFVIYRDRDFWFPETQEAEDQLEAVPATQAPAQPVANANVELPATVVAKASIPQKRAHNSKPRPKDSSVAPSSAPEAPSASATQPASVNATRTVLPPLEVEVVAGDNHRTVRPGTNSVRVDLQPGSPPQAATDVPDAGAAMTAASVTSNAAERVQMSADTAEVVTHPVKPGYPLLARQMKVQGSVILQALIGRDGAIQDLHVVSGPTILAGAAQQAVRQWRFKPHYLRDEAVETQAKITVNFTISTN